MLKFFLKRFFSAIFTLFLISTITFFLMKAIPGGPFSKNEKLSDRVRESIEEKYHLNDPIHKQYLDYMAGLLKGDLGPSFARPGVEVSDLMKQGFPISASIGGFAILMVILIGVPFGIIAAIKQNKAPDYAISFLSTLGVCIPSFVLATLFIFVFCYKLNILPSNGLDSWKHYIGPVVALGGFSLAFVTRLTRSSMLEIMQQDYIRTARAKGLPESVVLFKHGLRNALIPVVTYIGPTVAAILTGSFVVERIFALPGMGKHFTDSVGNRDYTTLMGATIVFAALYLVMILIVDVLYVVIDPRIKFD
ncbi:ABC transporter permease [Oceanirhabdus seepicola]|uniref:ABC transporter permease n=1 Tax=Oceanirhabdus seepicola TaxID=2828781 RepID=A0A9J6PC31_9CLOT|nr:ABC transporter permease [Oceanirhabdus seepicola]MCM1992597.1 ABC transporter permease [Oceanirhabdus seepicola]